MQSDGDGSLKEAPATPSDPAYWNPCVPSAPPMGFVVQYNDQQFSAPSAPSFEAVASVFSQPPAADHDAEHDADNFLEQDFALQPLASAPPARPFGFFPYSQTWATLERGLDPAAHHGYLFLGLTQCRHLPAMNRDGRTSDPYARVFLVMADGKKSEVLQSSRVNASVDPKFFAEFLFAVPNDVGARLEVQLFDYVMIGKDKPMGALTLPVDALPHGPERRTIALAQGEADVFISYTRCVVNSAVPPAQVLPPLRFVSERSNYFAGELVQAVLSYCVSGAPIEIYGVVVEATGYVRYHTSHKTHHRGANGSSSTHTHHHYVTNSIFSHKVVCLGRPKKDKVKMTLQPGRYAWPLQLWLPPQAPPSAHFDNGRVGISVVYVLTARVHIVGALVRDKKHALPLRVLQRYVPPALLPVDTQMKFAFQQSTPINIRARMGSNELWPGVEALVSVDLHNQSDRTITRGSADLVGYVQAIACGHRSQSWIQALSVDLKHVPGALPLNPGDHRSFQVPFVVPLTCAPSLHLQNGSVSWYVSVSLSWGLKSATAKIPVLMQAMCPRALAWFPAQPVLGVCEVYSGPTNFSILPADTPIQWWSLLPTTEK